MIFAYSLRVFGNPNNEIVYVEEELTQGDFGERDFINREWSKGNKIDQ